MSQVHRPPLGRLASLPPAAQRGRAAERRPADRQPCQLDPPPPPPPPPRPPPPPPRTHTHTLAPNDTTLDCLDGLCGAASLRL
eukprot:COSAG01_NODE_2426_length_7722_cov_2.700905_5_plen_83_part_00